MKIYLSHAAKDATLAATLAKRLRTVRGMQVWLDEDGIAPGENWAAAMGKALEESDVMLVLLTPGAMDSDRVRNDVQFAIVTERFENHLLTVYVGPTWQLGDDVPWILAQLPFVQISTPEDWHDVAEELSNLKKLVRRSPAYA
jgi:hypothetical protein